MTPPAGIMPMLPGLAVFRAVFAFAVNDTPDGGLTQLLEAAATALALGSGVVLGEFLASPLRYGAGRIGDLFRIEGPPGLRRAVGRVVRLQPAKSQQPTGTGGQRWRSVALEPTTADDVDAGYRGDWPATCTSATEVR
ncbi:putative transmembrane protein [Mycobacterium tuberculosis]|nr:putative transmembrane protein [Mycobacterium tuberculosis]